MKKLIWVALFAFLAFPAVSEAGVPGTYELNVAKMLKQLLPMALARAPKNMHDQIKAMMKQRLSARKMWMTLSANGKFVGYSKRKGKKKSKVGATGTWKAKKGVVTIHSKSVRDKKEMVMSCKVGKKELACQDTRNQKITVYFQKR